MNDSILLQEKQPQRFEGRNIRTPKRSGATNDIYLIQFEITREAWESLESIPKNALLEGIIWFHYGDDEATPAEKEKAAEKPKREKKPPKPHGEFGRYWQAMFKRGALNHPGLRQALDIPDDVTGEQTVKEALRARFGVESLTFIAPPLFEAFCDDGNFSERLNLASLITMSRQAAIEAQE